MGSRALYNRKTCFEERVAFGCLCYYIVPVGEKGTNMCLL